MAVVRGEPPSSYRTLDRTLLWIRTELHRRHLDPANPTVLQVLAKGPDQENLHQNCGCHPVHSCTLPLRDIFPIPHRIQHRSSTHNVPSIGSSPYTVSPRTSTQACARNGTLRHPITSWADTPRILNRQSITADFCKHKTSLK